MLATMRAQRWRKSLRVSEYGDEVCAYRGDEGRRCAVGALLDDEAAGIADSEGFIGQEIRMVPLLTRSGWPADLRSRRLYRSAQVIHDSRLNSDDGQHYTSQEAEARDKEARFALLALDFGLDYTLPP